MPRLFFALRPVPEQSTSILQSLHPLLSALGGVPVYETDLHLTLAFLGEVSADRMEAVHQKVCRIDPVMLCIELSCLDYWQKSRVLCLVPDRDTKRGRARQPRWRPSHCRRIGRRDGG